MYLKSRCCARSARLVPVSPPAVADNNIADDAALATADPTGRVTLIPALVPKPCHDFNARPDINSALYPRIFVPVCMYVHGIATQLSDMMLGTKKTLRRPGAVPAGGDFSERRLVDEKYKYDLLSGPDGASVSEKTPLLNKTLSYLKMAALSLFFLLASSYTWASAVLPRAASPDALAACPGYTATNVRTTSTGLTADLSLAGQACNVYGTDLAHLVLQVTYEDGEWF
jgi:hypothetical protein